MVYSEDMPEYTTDTTIPVDAYIHTLYAARLAWLGLSWVSLHTTAAL